ncbi:MAG: hypothetical protein PHI31_11915 [Desulfuromonadaceae bacterium]|nr:hypothetical protein [Desulfuromonadaceae bacterium]
MSVIDGPGGAPKKFPCPDCSCCQWCSDDRCRLCRNQAGCSRRKLSVAEQIALYESLNTPDNHK